MTKIQLRAGDIQTDIQCDDSEAESLAETAKMLQRWQMRQWKQASGAAVSVSPKSWADRR